MNDTRWSVVLAYVLAPLYYWLDLLGPDGRPSHSKVTWTVAFGFALGLLLFCAKRILSDGDMPSAAELTFLLAYSALTLATAGGLDGFKTWAKTKGGGTVQALADVASALEHPGKALDE